MLSSKMTIGIQSFRPIRSLRRIVTETRLAMLIAAFAVATTASSTVRAQESAAAVGGMSLRVSAQMVVGYRMKVREIAPPRVVERSPGVTELELHLEAASNVAWRLTIAAPIAHDSVTPRIEVRDGAGVWHGLDRAGPGVIAVAQREPCNPTPITVRIRVYDSGAASFATPRFMMDIAGGL